eukprot:GFKZ01000237.1.p1 GENE.GFKZ01000237.1~~GFKZ01000237.1.p1  ORF type:complete len:758 (-),score=75.03 GFKZ01000237.1:1980-4253(-)
MNIPLDDNNFSCVIRCPWIAPAQRQSYFGRVCLSATSRKRQRGKSQRKEINCCVYLSVWTPAIGNDGFNGRSFRRVKHFQCTVPEWGAPAKVLGVFQAFDDESGLEYSWVVASLTKRDGKHGIALLQCAENALSLVNVAAVRGNPQQAIVLRGPVVLYATPSFVRMTGKNGDISLDQVFNADCSQKNSPARYLVCTTEHDLEGVVACLEPPKSASNTLRVCTIFANGKSQREWVLRDVNGTSICYISVSVRRGISVLAEADGSIRLFELQSGQCLWTVTGNMDIESPRAVIFHRDMVLFSSRNPNTLWAVSLNDSKDENRKVRFPAKLFPDQCTGASTDESSYFLALWRDSVLLCDDSNGTCRADYDFSSAAIEREQIRYPNGYYLRTVIKNLETRLDCGVQRVTDVAERQDDKVSMIDHVRGLLISASGKRLKPFPDLFRGQLKELMRSPERRLPMRDASDEADYPSPSEKITVNGCSDPNDISPIARIIRTGACVDKSARFIVVRAYVTVLGANDEEDSESSGITLQLNVSFDRCMPAIWDVDRKRQLRKGDKCWLRACAPVSAVVSNGAGSLNDISLIVRIEATDGPSQHIASYSLIDVLSSTAETISEQDNGSLLSFEQKVYAVAQGRGAHDLNRLTVPEDICRGLTLHTREKLAYITFNITSVTELALAVARLRAVIDDDVRLRSTCELAQSALHAADVSLRALEVELQATRDITENQQTVGYNSENLRTLLKIQMEMDDCMGKVEEQYLGT